MKQQKIEKRILKLPKLDRSTFRRAYTAIRPFRKTGIRVEKEILKSKVIFHNYGHGGAGISLSPGTAWEVSELIDKENVEGKNIAVLGSGIVGLTAALELAQRGYNVTIYSKVIPYSKKDKKNEDLITSQVAVGIWHPSHCNFQNQKQQNLRCQKAYKVYQAWFQKKMKGLAEVIGYYEEPKDQYRSIFPEETGIPVKTVQLFFSPHSNKFVEVMEFKSIKVNLEFFLPELIKECEKKGVKFVNHELHSLQDVFKMKQKHIVNCLGYGARKIFGDELLEPGKGHVLEFENPEKVQHIIYLKKQGVNFHCFTDKVFIGHSRQDQEDLTIDESMLQKIYNRTMDFKKQYESPSPKL